MLEAFECRTAEGVVDFPCQLRSFDLSLGKANHILLDCGHMVLSSFRSLGMHDRILGLGNSTLVLVGRLVCIKTFTGPFKLDNAIVGVHQDGVFLGRVIDHSVLVCHLAETENIGQHTWIIPGFSKPNHVTYEVHLLGACIGRHAKRLLRLA